MKVAITGANGQVGSVLCETFKTETVIPLTRPKYDVSQPTIVSNLVDLKPDVVIHAAAMTHVDGCAQDPQQAYLVNGFGTQNVALACLQSGATMIYISTNEVFDGLAQVACHEYAPTNPINAYARSKLAGEQMAARLLQKLYIVRVSWVFNKGGNNFPAKIMQVADKLGQLKVVTDEVAAPTYAPDLAAGLHKLISTNHYGTYHLPNAGICSRYEFAQEILKQSGRGHIPIEPITSDSFQRASTPPKYTPLQNNLAAALGISMRPWQAALATYLAD